MCFRSEGDDLDDVEDVLAEACGHAGGLITRAVLMCIDQILTDCCWTGTGRLP